MIRAANFAPNLQNTPSFFVCSAPLAAVVPRIPCDFFDSYGTLFLGVTAAQFFRSFVFLTDPIEYVIMTKLFALHYIPRSGCEISSTN